LTGIKQAKEERDIGEVSTLTVKRTLYLRLPQADTYNYEAEELKEKDPAIGEASARRTKKTGQAKAKTTGSGDSKGGESQKEVGCSRSRRCEGFQTSRSEEIGRR
jgi:hypothetical protein